MQFGTMVREKFGHIEGIVTRGSNKGDIVVCGLAYDPHEGRRSMIAFNPIDREGLEQHFVEVNEFLYNMKGHGEFINESMGASEGVPD